MAKCTNVANVTCHLWTNGCKIAKKTRLLAETTNRKDDIVSLSMKYLTILADATKSYYTEPELAELAAGLGVDFSYNFYTGLQHITWARSLIQTIEQGNNRRFLTVLVISLLSRAREGVAYARGYDKVQHHQSMVDLLTPLKSELEDGGLPSELSVPERNPFTAKSECRELLGQTETEVTIVDNWVGTGTLDCLRDVNQHIKVLTGQQAGSLADGFERALQDFKTEGYSIEVRKHPKLHDRYILFNDRCWLAGSSLKDAGKKAFNIIEVVDSKALIQAEVTKKWGEAIPI